MWKHFPSFRRATRQNCGMSCELRTLRDVRNRFGKRETNLWKIYEFPRKIILSSAHRAEIFMIFLASDSARSRHHHHHHQNIICIKNQKVSECLFIFQLDYLLPTECLWCVYIFNELKFFYYENFRYSSHAKFMEKYCWNYPKCKPNFNSILHTHIIQPLNIVLLNVVSSSDNWIKIQNLLHPRNSTFARCTTESWSHDARKLIESEVEFAHK